MNIKIKKNRYIYNGIYTASTICHRQSTNMLSMIQVFSRFLDFWKKYSFNIQIFICFILMLLVELKCLTKLHIFYFTLFPVAIIIGDFIEWFIRIKYF